MTTIATTTAGSRAFAECTRDRHIALDGEEGAVLSRRISVTDELGRCHYRDREVITDKVWAKKVFQIHNADVFAAALALNVGCEVAEDVNADGDLYTYAETRDARLLIDVNGHTLEFPWPEQATYWQRAAFSVPIPVEALRSGLNEVILRSADATEWYVLIEDSLWPNRSARSIDAGRTWDDEHLGPSGSHDGEYMLRLQLEGHPPQGTIVSPSIDLATLLSGARVGAPLALHDLTLDAEAETPEGTAIALEIRYGSTPSYEPFRWTGWLSGFGEEALSEGEPRFAQWRATLRTSSPQSTPRLTAVTLRAEVEAERAADAQAYDVLVDDTPTIARSSYPFAYQSYDEPRVHIARERWQLDEVVAGAADELTALARLADWTRHQWEDGWNMRSGLRGGELRYCPPWDGLVIRELASRDLSLGMCTHYATVFVQAATALGFIARHNVIHAHCVAEVWVNDWQKWVMFDPGCDTDDDRKGTYHLERHGVPLSTLEAHQAWIDNDLEGLAMVPVLDDGVGPDARFALDTWLRHFERFCITLREDDLTSLSPGEPEHGWGSYHFDGYLWWEDAQTPKLVCFTRTTDREADLCWGVNQVAVHLLATDDPHALGVTLDTMTPNLDWLEIQMDDGAWRETSQEFVWRLRPGENRLAVRSVNRFGRSGPVASLTLVAP